MATVNIGADEFATWDKTIPVTRTAVVSNPSGSVSYAWTFTSRPTGSTATITNATTATASFTPDKAGAYVLSAPLRTTAVRRTTQRRPLCAQRIGFVKA